MEIVGRTLYMAESEQTSNHSEFLRLLAEHEAPIRAFLRAILSSVADADEAFQLTMTDRNLLLQGFLSAHRSGRV